MISACMNDDGTLAGKDGSSPPPHMLKRKREQNDDESTRPVWRPSHIRKLCLENGSVDEDVSNAPACSSAFSQRSSDNQCEAFAKPKPSQAPRMSVERMR